MSEKKASVINKEQTPLVREKTQEREREQIPWVRENCRHKGESATFKSEQEQPPWMKRTASANER